ncbi:MAG: histidine phosphatase family protein [Gammaproteobacteria bacterium]|nr:histidine phosphatase family protein [Gammaproteobacteria bacterium]
MPIYLARHGQTQWNTQGRKQGQGNSELTAKGIEQAKASAKLLTSLIGDSYQYSSVRLISSPLKRAKITAQYILSNLNWPGMVLETADALMEISYGNWEGLTNEEVDECYPGQRKIRNKDRWNYLFDNGESYAMVFERVTMWMKTLDEREVNVIVTHDMVSRIMRGHYLGFGKSQMLKLTHPHNTIYLLDQETINSHSGDCG